MSKKENFVSSYVAQMMKNVHPSWKKILLGTEIKEELTLCLEKLQEDLQSRGVTKLAVQKKGLDKFLRPAPSHIFAAFRHCDAHNLRVIIVGQDPYPDKNRACGMSFSVPRDQKIPDSLLNIYKCLRESGLVSNLPKHGDLTNWARQGVLLLNTYLTRVPNICRSESGGLNVNGDGDSSAEFLHRFWLSFTQKLLQYLCVHQGKDYLSVMLWGKEAQKLEQHCGEARVYVWGHPSSTNRQNNVDCPQAFRYFPGFREVNVHLGELGLPPIEWNPEKEQVPLLDRTHFAHILGREIDWNSRLEFYDDNSESAGNIQMRQRLQKKVTQLLIAAVDGGCSRNGQVGARGSYGVHFPRCYGESQNLIPEQEFGGEQPPQELALQNGEIVESGPKVAPTNNRGELLAAIYALRYVIQKEGRAPMVLITDSVYVVRLVNYLVWEYAERNFENVKNADLCRLLHHYLLRLAAFLGVEGRWEKLIQSADRRKKGEVTRNSGPWSGLTVIYQEGHLDKKGRLPEEGTKEWHAYQANKAADALCHFKK